MSAFYRSLLQANGGLQAVLSNIRSYVDHVEPHSGGSVTEPSTMFCCVYRLLQLQSPRQLRRLVDSKDSPYVRAAGFLAMRYSSKVHDMWDAFQMYLFDQEEFRPTAKGGSVTTVGQWLGALLNDEKYFSTILPRLPTSLKREIGSRMLQIRELALRTSYLRNVEQAGHFREPGTRVEVLDKEAWQQAEIVTLDESSSKCVRCVVRLVDGKTTEVSIGFLRLPQSRTAAGGSSPRIKRARRRSRSRARSRSSSGSGRSSSAAEERGHAGEGETTTGEPGQAAPAEIRQRYLLLERDKATCDPGTRYFDKPAGHRVQLQGREPGYRTCKLMDFKQWQRQNENRPPEQAQEQVTQQDVLGRSSAKRQRELAEVYQKYGGGAGGARKAGHPLVACRPDPEVDAPDTLRLG